MAAHLPLQVALRCMLGTFASTMPVPPARVDLLFCEKWMVFIFCFGVVFCNVGARRRPTAYDHTEVRGL